MFILVCIQNDALLLGWGNLMPIFIESSDKQHILRNLVCSWSGCFFLFNLFSVVAFLPDQYIVRWPRGRVVKTADL